MDVITGFVVEHAHHAHYIVFGCLMLAGLNVPISEDLLLIFSGALASTLVPENLVPLFVWAFLGAYISDWVAYWLGRRLGIAIFETRWFKGHTTRRRLRKVGRFYERYGVSTLFFGRFIPFGVRNCLFISAGMGRMHFGRFLLTDGIACVLSNSILFSLGYYFGKNHHALQNYLHTYNSLIFSVFVLVIGGVALRYIIGRRTRKRLAAHDDQI